MAAKNVEYRILGPLAVCHDGRPVRISGAQQRAVLAALLLRANRMVSVERLVELLWGEEPPGRARTLVHGCVARLRRDLRMPGDDSGPLLTQPPGYLLRVRPGELDLDRFTTLADGAGASGDRAARLREALALWRGPALADIQLPAIRAAAAGLDERMISVLEDRIDLDLRQGKLDGLVGELSALVHEHPLRERLWAQLMLARCAGRRPAEALAAYRELRRKLIDQLGIEPSGRLRRMERAILADEDVWAVYRSGDSPAEAGRQPAPPDPPQLAPRPASPALLGRSVEVAKLREALNDLADGSVLLGVAGDPGIGKTCLLAELEQLARQDGRPVLAGRAAEFEKDAPFAVIKNALEDHLRTVDPARLAGLAAGDRLLLTSIFPMIMIPAAGQQDSPATELIAAERYRLHRAFRALLDIVARPAGLVLILDDLHWCDDGSAELLAHLLRHPPAAAVLLAFGYRPRQLDTRLHHEVLLARRRRTGTVIEVGPLTFAEATALLPRALGADRRRQLYTASEGNPFYLEFLARPPAPGDPGAPIGDEVVPAAVGAALAGEFAQLAAVEQRVAQAAALVGDVLDSRLIAVVADLSEADTLDAIDELGRRDLIRRHRASFKFRHPLLRSAAYQQAPAGWRVAAHRRAADELARRGSPLAARARHVALAAEPGDLDAVRLLEAAAAEAMHTTPAAAAHWCAAALRLLPQRAQTVEMRLRLLNVQATALGITGHLARGRDILNEILHLLPAGSEERIAVLGSLATLHQLLGNHVQAQVLLHGELARLPDQRGAPAAALRVSAVLCGVMSGSVAVDDIHTAIDVARGSGDRPLLASAVAIGAVASRSFDMAGRRSPAEWADEATRLVDAMPDADLARRLDATLFLGWAESYLERFGPATRHARRALGIARRTGQGRLVGPLQMLIGVLDCMTGDLVSAAEALDDALESAILTGAREIRGRLLAYQAWVSVWSGDVAGASESAAESVSLVEPAQATNWQAGQAAGSLALVRFAAGDPDRCLELMLQAGGGPGLPAVRQVWQPMWLDTLSAAATAAGRHQEAAEWADRAAMLPADDTLSRRSALILLAQVHPLLHTRPERAVPLAQQAARLFDRAGDRLGAARARLHTASAFAGTGDAHRAEHEAERARLAFLKCGARPDWLFRREHRPPRAEDG
ncbi:hypothetical protein DMB66_10460 [Actinoplanes sp. ATCC 53533]|uniref:AfsR/SARP family transcriptional regulator n=1 Tax=Actinoplanes sp. ATCC 53533 TaxID=1288362 RepID=UPI000F76D5A2|nr:AfsR/SARP family transcriptional regulator [Actinoplanes sp. ATCC 53533]RSM69420.1 hypothetical protein DMB66_10460 [Actinoplanes sp. ATCC 53533]